MRIALESASAGCRCFADSAWWWRTVIDVGHRSPLRVARRADGREDGAALCGHARGELWTPVDDEGEALGIGHWAFGKRLAQLNDSTGSQRRLLSTVPRWGGRRVRCRSRGHPPSGDVRCDPRERPALWSSPNDAARVHAARRFTHAGLNASVACSDMSGVGVGCGGFGE